VVKPEAVVTSPAVLMVVAEIPTVPVEAAVVVGRAEFFKRVVSGLDESELEPPHDATATRAIAKMAH
jgi:hypothetical protein